MFTFLTQKYVEKFCGIEKKYYLCIELKDKQFLRL